VSEEAAAAICFVSGALGFVTALAAPAELGVDVTAWIVSIETVALVATAVSSSAFPDVPVPEKPDLPVSPVWQFVFDLVARVALVAPVEPFFPVVTAVHVASAAAGTGTLAGVLKRHVVSGVLADSATATATATATEAAPKVMIAARATAALPAGAVERAVSKWLASDLQSDAHFRLRHSVNEPEQRQYETGRYSSSASCRWPCRE